MSPSYKAAYDTSPAASQLSLAAQTAERVDLYRKVPLPIHVDKVDIPDGPPSDGELRDVVRGLGNTRAVGASGLQAEHIKVWLHNVVHEEKEK